MDQLASMIHSAAQKSDEIRLLEEATEGWTELCEHKLQQEAAEQTRWSSLSGNSEQPPSAEEILSDPSPEDHEDDGGSEVGAAKLLRVFDKIDSDGFGFAPRMDLLRTVSELALDDSSLRFVVCGCVSMWGISRYWLQVGSLEKMTLKIVDRDSFGKIVSQWVELHLIMEDDDREDQESLGSPRSPTSGGSLGGLGSPKGNDAVSAVITQVTALSYLMRLSDSSECCRHALMSWMRARQKSTVWTK